MLNQAESPQIDASRAVGLPTSYTPHKAPKEIATAAECVALLLAAERELGAFRAAVRGMFGPDAARGAADDWLELFETSKGERDTTPTCFRRITIQAASRLAGGLAGQFSPRQFEEGTPSVIRVLGPASRQP